MTQLTSLSMWSCDEDMKNNTTFLEPLTNMVKLRLGSLSPLPCGFRTVSTMRGLRHLKMHGLLASDKEYDYGPDALSRVTNLAVLHWHACGQLTEHCIDSVAHLRNLTELSFADVAFPDNLTSFSALAWLRKLTLSSHSSEKFTITDDQMHDMCNLPSLSYLKLKYAGLTDSACSRLSCLASLQQLEIKGHHALTHVVYEHVGKVGTLRSLLVEGGNILCLLQRKVNNFSTLTRLQEAVFNLSVTHPRLHAECLKAESLLKQLLPYASICYYNTDSSTRESQV